MRFDQAIGCGFVPIALKFGRVFVIRLDGGFELVSKLAVERQRRSRHPLQAAKCLFSPFGV